MFKSVKLALGILSFGWVIACGESPPVDNGTGGSSSPEPEPEPEPVEESRECSTLDACLGRQVCRGDECGECECERFTLLEEEDAPASLVRRMTLGPNGDVYALLSDSSLGSQVVRFPREDLSKPEPLRISVEFEVRAMFANQECLFFVEEGPTTRVFVYSYDGEERGSHLLGEGKYLDAELRDNGELLVLIGKTELEHGRLTRITADGSEDLPVYIWNWDGVNNWFPLAFAVRENQVYMLYGRGGNSNGELSLGWTVNADDAVLLERISTSINTIGSVNAWYSALGAFDLKLGAGSEVTLLWSGYERESNLADRLNLWMLRLNSSRNDGVADWRTLVANGYTERAELLALSGGYIVKSETMFGAFSLRGRKLDIGWSNERSVTCDHVLRVEGDEILCLDQSESGKFIRYRVHFPDPNKGYVEDACSEDDECFSGQCCVSVVGTGTCQLDGCAPLHVCDSDEDCRGTCVSGICLPECREETCQGGWCREIGGRSMCTLDCLKEEACDALPGFSCQQGDDARGVSVFACVPG